MDAVSSSRQGCWKMTYHLERGRNKVLKEAYSTIFPKRVDLSWNLRSCQFSFALSKHPAEDNTPNSPEFHFSLETILIPLGTALQTNPSPYALQKFRRQHPSSLLMLSFSERAMSPWLHLIYPKCSDVLPGIAPGLGLLHTVTNTCSIWLQQCLCQEWTPRTTISWWKYAHWCL